MKSLIAVTFMIISLTLNTAKASGLNCKDENGVILKIDTTNGKSTLTVGYGNEVKTLSNLDCKISAKGRNHFVCQDGQNKNIEYYSKTEAVEDFFGKSSYTTLFKREWDSDVVKSNQYVDSLVGNLADICL